MTAINAAIADNGVPATNLFFHPVISPFIIGLALALISWLLWKYLSVSPFQQQQQEQQQRPPPPLPNGDSIASNSSTAQSRSHTARRSLSRRDNNNINDGDMDSWMMTSWRQPPHLAITTEEMSSLITSKASSSSDPSSILSGFVLQGRGLVPFRYTHACRYESRLQQQQLQTYSSSNSKNIKHDAIAITTSDTNNTTQERDLIVRNRRERTRIFARMFSTTSITATTTTTTSSSTPSSSVTTTATTSTSSSSSSPNNIMASTFLPPPNCGANIVLTIPHTDVGTVYSSTSSTGNNNAGSFSPPSGGGCCPKLQKILYLLGTYYNLFVLIDTSTDNCNNEEEEEEEEAGKKTSSTKTTPSLWSVGGGGENNEQQVRKMRDYIHTIRSTLLNQGGADDSIPTSSPTPQFTSSSSSDLLYQLNPQILPGHRIVFTSTPKGRIAFVRQLPTKAEFIIDYDSSVKHELERFGFRVWMYPKKTTRRTTTTTTTAESCSSSSTMTMATTSNLGKFLIP